MQLFACYLNITTHLFVPPAIYCSRIEQRHNLFKGKKPSIFIYLTLSELHAASLNQKFQTSGHLDTSTSVTENLIPAICSVCMACVSWSLIRAGKAVHINQPQDGNMIAAALVYNAAFYLVQSLSLAVDSRQ